MAITWKRGVEVSTVGRRVWFTRIRDGKAHTRRYWDVGEESMARLRRAVDALPGEVVPVSYGYEFAL